MKIPATVRRARLAQLIAERYKSQADFVTKTGENQGEVSALLKSKSFGEKKARTIEAKCGLPVGWLDVDAGAPGAADAPEESHTGGERGEVATQNAGGQDLQRALLDQTKLLLLYWSVDDIGRRNILSAATNEVTSIEAIANSIKSARHQA